MQHTQEQQQSHKLQTQLEEELSHKQEVIRDLQLELNTAKVMPFTHFATSSPLSWLRPGRQASTSKMSRRMFRSVVLIMSSNSPIHCLLHIYQAHVANSWPWSGVLYMSVLLLITQHWVSTQCFCLQLTWESVQRVDVKALESSVCCQKPARQHVFKS